VDLETAAIAMLNSAGHYRALRWIGEVTRDPRTRTRTDAHHSRVP